MCEEHQTPPTPSTIHGLFEQHTIRSSSCSTQGIFASLSWLVSCSSYMTCWAVVLGRHVGRSYLKSCKSYRRRVKHIRFIWVTREWSFSALMNNLKQDRGVELCCAPMYMLEQVRSAQTTIEHVSGELMTTILPKVSSVVGQLEVT